MSGVVVSEKRSGVRWITINRPERKMRLTVKRSLRSVIMLWRAGKTLRRVSWF